VVATAGVAPDGADPAGVGPALQAGAARRCLRRVLWASASEYWTVALPNSARRLSFGGYMVERPEVATVG